MSQTQATQSARQHFEQVIRHVGTGYDATVDGMRNPLQLIAPADTRSEPAAAALTSRLDTRA